VKYNALLKGSIRQPSPKGTISQLCSHPSALQTGDLEEQAKDRVWLRHTAIAMRDSGALRIKEHTKGFAGMGVYKDSWKGECVYPLSTCLVCRTTADHSNAWQDFGGT
jgi:hypothetical protein